MKKQIRFLLCTLLLIGCMALGAGAYGETEDAEEETDIVSLQAVENVIDFGGIQLSENTAAFAAVYAKDGRMLYAASATVENGRVKLTVPDAVFAEMETAKLFRMDSTGFAPMRAVITKNKVERSDIETPRF